MLFLILMSSAYVKLNICMLRRHRFYVSHPPRRWVTQGKFAPAGHGLLPVMRLRGMDWTPASALLWSGDAR
jgi:hypothetical protein